MELLLCKGKRLHLRAWRHVHDVVTAAGARYMVWMWCPNVPYPRATPMQGLYPGDSYVDLVGLDGYNAGTTRTAGWQSYQIFYQGLANLKALTKREIVLAEVGSVEQSGNEAAWVADFFRTTGSPRRQRRSVLSARRCRR